jgi:hypothetical protein
VIGFENGELIVTKDDAKKSELLYQGLSGNVLRLSYREYSMRLSMHILTAVMSLLLTASDFC